MTSKPCRAVALIPARAGSKRVQGKNIREVNGHPLIAYTIVPALKSGIFDKVLVSTDSPEIADIAKFYGADVPFLRPPELAGDLSPDVEWVKFTLEALEKNRESYGIFSLLRPTSPFRGPETIRRAFERFLARDGVDSLRAVEKCKQHPGKMWVLNGENMVPLLKDGPENPPWHSSPYQALPEVYVQNASLEIAWSRVVLEGGTIAGKTVTPFLTQNWEGFDINEPKDWWYMEHVLKSREAELPQVDQKPYAKA